MYIKKTNFDEKSIGILKELVSTYSDEKVSQLVKLELVNCDIKSYPLEELTSALQTN
jgi:hypothetical protein